MVKKSFLASFFILYFAIMAGFAVETSINITKGGVNQTGSVNYTGTILLTTGSSCTSASECSSGYCVDGYCCNSACTGSNYQCNVAGSLGTCTYVSPGGGGGTAGGGITGAVTETAEEVSETKTLTTISKESTGAFKFTKSDDLMIEEIDITVSNDVSGAKVTVKETTKPLGASEAISTTEGDVYKYLEITKENIDDEDIASVRIKFKVPKSWVSNNDIDPNTVILKRYFNSTWESLTTIMTSEDSEYYYFEAESGGLSVFAITGQKKTTAPKEGIEEALAEEEEEVAAPAPIPWTYFIGVIIFIIIVFAVWKIMRRRTYKYY